MLVVEFVAAWVECKVAVAEVAVVTVDVEAVIAHAAFGVTIVRGVVVNADVFAVLVAVKNLHLLRLHCQGGIAVIHS